jgi:hypothetical protein
MRAWGKAQAVVAPLFFFPAFFLFPVDSSMPLYGDRCSWFATLGLDIAAWRSISLFCHVGAAYIAVDWTGMRALGLTPSRALHLVRLLFPFLTNAQYRRIRGRERGINPRPLLLGLSIYPCYARCTPAMPNPPFGEGRPYYPALGIYAVSVG